MEFIESEPSTIFTSSEAVKNEELIKELRQNFVEIQAVEVKRLTKDCLKLGKNIKKLAGMIVGADNLDKFMIISRKELQRLLNVKETVKTFSFTTKLIPKPSIIYN